MRSGRRHDHIRPGQPTRRNLAPTDRAAGPAGGASGSSATSIPFGPAGGIYYAVPLLIPVYWGLRSGSKERAVLLTLFAAAAGAGSILLEHQDGQATTGKFVLGVTCAIGAGTSRTLYLPVTDRLIRERGRRYTELVIAWSMLGVGVLAFAMAAVTGGFLVPLSWPIIGWALLVGLLNNVIPAHHPDAGARVRG